MLTGRVGGQKRGVAGGVGVVDGRPRHGLGQHRVGQGEEVAQQPEQVGHAHAQARHGVAVDLHELPGAEQGPQRVTAGRGGHAIGDEVPHRPAVRVLGQ